MKKIIVLIILALLGAYFFFQPQISEGVTKGDLVEAKYTITLENGTVFATTDEEVARANNLSVYHHGSYAFIVGESEQYPLDEIVIGMTAGEKKSKDYAPADSAGTKTIPRYKSVERMLSFPLRPKFAQDKFHQYFGDLVLNDTVRSDALFPWAFKVINVNENNTVTLEAIVREGEKYVVPGIHWNSTITDAWTGTIFLRQEPELGKVIEASWGNVTVTNFTDDMITVRRDTFEGALMQLPAGPHVVTRITDSEIYLRQSRGVLKENAFTISIEVLSVKQGIRPPKEKNKLKTLPADTPVESSASLNEEL